jgi:hypothetical protein
VTALLQRTGDPANPGVRRAIEVAAEARAGCRAGLAFIVSGQACFLAMMLACCAITPSRTAIARGLSYYGTYAETAVPYAVGFSLYIPLTALGIARVRPTSTAVQRFRIAVMVVLALAVGVPLTPYRVDLVFDWVHIGLASTLFAAGLVLGGWLALRLVRDRISLTLFVLESGAAISMLAAQIGWHGYMIPSELWFELCVFGLVVQAVRRLPRDAAAIHSGKTLATA